MHKAIYNSAFYLSAAIAQKRDWVGSEDINLHGENRECMLQTVPDHGICRGKNQTGGLTGV